MDTQTLETIFNVIIYVIVFLFGITIGSFLNVCILRLPRGESLTKKNSHCMTCGAYIKWYDLIPVLSYIILGGKCRSCKAKISPRYMIIESLSGIIFMICYTVYPYEKYGVYFIALFLLLAGLIVLAFQDLDTQEMCISVIIYTFIEAVITIVLSLDGISLLKLPVTLRENIIGAFAVSVPLLIIGFVITPLIYVNFLSADHKDKRRLRKALKKEDNAKTRRELERVEAKIKETGFVYGFGMGDILVMAVGGLALGYKAAFVAAIIAIVSGAVYAVILAAMPRDENSSNKFAFGPFLILGLTVAAFCGNFLFDSYMSYLAM